MWRNIGKQRRKLMATSVAAASSSNGAWQRHHQQRVCGRRINISEKKRSVNSIANISGS